MVQHAYLPSVGGKRGACDGVYSIFHVGNAIVSPAYRHCRMDCGKGYRKNRRRRPVQQIYESVSAGGRLVFSLCGKLRH